MKFIDSLFESRLFRSSDALKRKSAEDIKNITFLYFLTLTILSEEFETAPWAQEYLENTFRYGFQFNTVQKSETDLKWALYIIKTKRVNVLNQSLRDENETEFKRMKINESNLRTWSRKVIKGRATEQDHRKFLTTLESDLHIMDGDYKSMRKLVISWVNLSDSQKSLVCTRLKYALNHHMRLSEIYPIFSDFATNKKYILKNTQDPETGKTLSLGDIAKTIGLGSLVGILGAIGLARLGSENIDNYRSRVRGYFKNLNETTSSGIASIAMPIGGIVKRANREPKKFGKWGKG